MKTDVMNVSEMLSECRGGVQPLSQGPEWWNPVELYDSAVRLQEPNSVQAMMDAMGLMFDL